MTAPRRIRTGVALVLVLAGVAGASACGDTHPGAPARAADIATGTRTVVDAVGGSLSAAAATLFFRSAPAAVFADAGDP
ncbi:hypothetical protein, partial [Tsukamurella soli]|uniref:hypothetical protein n=1 Tax=Tsukamurella soli TaxID=644556 RepID=UPI0031EB6E95